MALSYYSYQVLQRRLMCFRGVSVLGDSFRWFVQVVSVYSVTNSYRSKCKIPRVFVLSTGSVVCGLALLLMFFVCFMMLLMIFFICFMMLLMFFVCFMFMLLLLALSSLNVTPLDTVPKTLSVSPGWGIAKYRIWDQFKSRSVPLCLSICVNVSLFQRKRGTENQ